MCGKKLKLFSVLLGLLLLFCFSPFCFFCFAEVRLTEQETQQILTEIEESKKELEAVKTELSDVKTIYSEQKKSYEKQLKEAEKKNRKLKTFSVATGSSSAVLMIVTVLLIIF